MRSVQIGWLKMAVTKITRRTWSPMRTSVEPLHRFIREGGLRSVQQPSTVPRRILGDRHRRQSDFAAIGNSAGFQTDMKSQYWRLDSSPKGYTIDTKWQTSPLASSVEAPAGQQDGHQPPAKRNGTNARRAHSDSTVSDVPITAQKRKLLWDNRDAKGRFTSDIHREHDDTRIQVSPFATTLVASSSRSPRTQSPPNPVDAASKVSSATT